MVYGLVRDVYDQAEMTFMTSKRIPATNTFSVPQVNVLLNRVNRGDVIWLATVADFPSVTRFVAFADMVLKLGVQLRIAHEPYLELGNGRHWRMPVREHVNALVALEKASADRLFSAFAFNDVGKGYVRSCIADITVGILSMTYSSDGILHRGR